MESSARKLVYVGVFTMFVLLGLLVYGYLTLTKLQEAHIALKAELETTRATLASSEEKILSLEAVIEITKQEYAVSEENGSELLRLLTLEKERNRDFEDRIDDITGTVGKLDKLSKINPQLLQKYSKVYFLNEHSAPDKVTKIDANYLFTKDTPEYTHSQVAPFLNSLLKNAKGDGINLLVVSAYRSFDEQKSIKGAYTTVYGSGANTFSADQGYSEHQLGTTVDFTTQEIGGGLTGFQNTEAYTWLQKNAYKYGFVLSYPMNNTYYVFEPWHWRFVGEDLARDLHRDGMSFYDMTQTEIDKYLISIFD